MSTMDLNLAKRSSINGTKDGLKAPGPNPVRPHSSNAATPAAAGDSSEVRPSNTITSSGQSYELIKSTQVRYIMKAENFI